MIDATVVKMWYEEAKRNHPTCTHLITYYHTRTKSDDRLQIPWNETTEPPWNTVENALVQMAMLGCTNMMVYDLSKPFPSGIPNKTW